MHAPARIRISSTVLASLALAGCMATPSLAPSAAPSATPTASTPAPSPAASPAETVTLVASPGTAAPRFFGPLVPMPSGIAVVVRNDDASESLLFGSGDGRTFERFDAGVLGDVAGLAGSQGDWLIAASGPDGGTRLWSSTNGRTWARVAGAASMAGSTPERLLGGPRGFVLLGGSASSTSTSFLWTSLDGQAWSDAQTLDPAGLSDAFVLDGAFVAFGGAIEAPVVYLSTDGVHWRSIPIDPAAPFGSNVLLRMRVAGGLAVLVDPGQSGGREVWFGSISVTAGLPDINWQPGSGPETFGEAAMVAGAGNDTAGVMLGYAPDSHAPLAWTSTDGKVWAKTVLPAALMGNGVPDALGATDTTFVALGWNVDTAGRMVRQPWRSTDGVTWSPVDTAAFGTLGPPLTGPCPSPAPTLVADYIAMDPGLRPICFEDQVVRITGFVTDCGGCGGTSPYVASPAWLIDALGYFRFWLVADAPSQGGGSLGVQVNPAHPIKVPPVGTRVELTGHFADPAATTCRLTPADGSGVALLPPALAIAQCRQAFVVTKLVIIAN